MKKKMAITIVSILTLCILVTGGPGLAADYTAPVVISETAAFDTITEDSSDRTGVAVSEMVVGNVTYPTGSIGVAITRVDSSHGEWWYFSGTYWYDIADVSETNALLLTEGHNIIFIPDNNWYGTAVIEYRGWNGTTGSDLGYADTSVNGGDTAFSAGKVASTVTVTPVNDVPIIVDSFGDKVLEFDGLDDYAIIDGPTHFSGSFTFEAWCRWGALNQWSRLFDFGNGSPGDNLWVGMQDNNGLLMCEVILGEDYESHQFVVGLDTPVDQWIHVAVVIDADAGYAYIYRNGAPEAYEPMGNTIDAERIYNYFGRSNWAADKYFKGNMREVRFWSTVRTKDQIILNMNKPLNGDESGLLAYYPMNEGTGTALNNAANGSALADALIDGPAWRDLSGINSLVSTVKNRPGEIDLTISDVETEDLTVTAASSDQALISDDRLTWNENGHRRTLVLTPNLDQTGECEITVTADDGTAVTTESFLFIVNDCENGTVSLNQTAYTIDEDDDALAVSILRTGGSTGTVSVDYATNDISAQAGTDYTQAYGTVVFEDGDSTSKVITIPIIDDAEYEGDEAFQICLDNAQGGAVISTRKAEATIADDERPSTNALLNSLSYRINGGGSIAIPGFTSNTFDYAITLPETTPKNAVIALQPVPSESHATVTANDGVTLADGTGTARVVLTAQDGKTTQTYTVDFAVAKTKPTPTPTPTPAPIPTATPAPTPTPSPMATPIPTPTRKPAVTAAPTATAPPTAAPTATATATAIATPTVNAAPEPSETQTQNVQYVSITGTLLDSGGNPIEGALIELHSDPITAYTDADGRFYFSDVPLTRHTLVVKLDDQSISELPLSFERADSFSMTEDDKSAKITYTENTAIIDVTLIVDKDHSGVTIQSVQEKTGGGFGFGWWLLIAAAAAGGTAVWIMIIKKRRKEEAIKTKRDDVF